MTPFPDPLAVPPQVADPLRAAAAVNRVSNDAMYRRHEFVTWQGGYHYSNGWTPPEVRNAVTFHLRGMFWQSATLARDCIRYPPIKGAMEQRLAPAEKAKWSIQEDSGRAPGRFAREDLEVAWSDFRAVNFSEVLRDYAFMGLSWIHVHMVVDERGIEVPVLKRWPLEAVMWRPRSPAFAGGYYAITADSGLVRMVHGDAHWFCIGMGERPHEVGAVASLGLSYVAGELSRRDRAGLSEAAGRAAPVAQLKEGVAVDSEIGLSMQDVIAEMGRGRKGIVVPHGTNVSPFQIVSDTSFFREALADEIALVSFALLGQAGTMAPGAGGGVYMAPAFGAVAESVIEKQHEVIERGFTEGLCVPLTAINYPAIAREDAPRLVGVRPTSAAEAKSEGELALQLAAAVKAQRDAGLEPTQEDVDALAERMRTRTIKLGEKPRQVPPPPSTT